MTLSDQSKFSGGFPYPNGLTCSDEFWYDTCRTDYSNL